MNDTETIFHRAVSKLLTEIFDGPPGDEAYILNPRDPGLLRQLESIPASVASTPPGPGRSTIAAHVDHLHYGLSLLVRWIAGEPDPFGGADWNASWKRNSVSDEEWRALCDALRKDADSWRRASAGRTEWDDITAAGAISSVAHTAYHLGAIRQILPLAQR